MPCFCAACMASRATGGVVSESAAKMPPVWNQRAPSRPKISLPVDCPGLSCETAVWPRSEQPTAARTPKPRSVKLRPLRDGAPDAVVLDPAQVRLVDAALVDEVLDEPADRVVHERRDDGGLEAEAALEAAGHVVFAAAFPDLEGARGVDAALAGIEAQHHLAEAHEVEAAAGLGLHGDGWHRARNASAGGRGCQRERQSYRPTLRRSSIASP